MGKTFEQELDELVKKHLVTGATLDTIVDQLFDAAMQYGGLEWVPA